MRTTALLLPVSLVLALVGGCSTSRFGLAKADPPAKKPSEDGVIKEYGNPWKKPKPENPEPSKEIVAEMAKVKKEMEAAKAASSDLTPWLKNAAEAEAKGELATAKGLYQKILDKDANNAEAHHRLAVIADQQQDARTADEHYLKALTLNRRDADLLSDMGYSLYLRGKLDESEKRLKEALEANPYHRGAHSNLGLVYGRQGKYDQALAAFRQSGTEADAQRNIAQIFPNGRPNAMNHGQPGGTALADNARRGAPPLPTDVDQRLVNPQMAEMMQRMQQERDAAIRARELQAQAPNPPTGGQPLANNAPLVSPVGPMNPMMNAQNNGGSVPWPPVTTNPPPTFNQVAGNNPAMQPQSGMVLPGDFATNNPISVAKPQDANPFWTGNLERNTAAIAPNNPMPPGNPANNNFAQNMNPPANYGAPMNPPGNNPWGNSPSSPGMGNDFARQNNGMMDPQFQPSSFTNSGAPNQPMSDAQRIAARMAMNSGHGGLLPVVNPGPNGAALPPGNPNNGVGWAYGEMSGNGSRDVENAVYSRQLGSDRNAALNNAHQTTPGSIAPGQPWGDWTSPAPAPINWQNDASGNPGATPPPWAPGAATNGQPLNGSSTTPPAWTGGNNNGAGPANTNTTVDTYRWTDASINKPNGGSLRNDIPANGNNGGNPITIPNWPNAPMRP